MRVRENIYNGLVNRTPYITMKYRNYRNKSYGIKRGFAWFYLLGLNFRCYTRKILRLEEERYYGDYSNKVIVSKQSESSLYQREKPQDLAKRLSKYDVISFDVFDTLLFRPFSQPTDMFFLVEEKLDYPNFRTIRQQLEMKLRQLKSREGISEVSLDEIWELIELETGIDRYRGAEMEFQCELEQCFANPYMLEVLKYLEHDWDKLIITSDMYLSKNQIERMLAHSGFPQFKKYYVSCESGDSKSNGKIYGKIIEEHGRDKKYVHIGDNQYSDIKQGKANGFDTVYYPNVNEVGQSYRADDMSIINGSLYRGLVNSYILNGLQSYSQAYEFGFIYGGLFVLGYCQWIQDYIERNQIDKCLFLSRDGEVISKVYQMMYPDAPSEYVYWSRIAGTKMTAQYYRYDYLRRFLYHKINQSYTLQQVFQSMELEDMLFDFIELEQGKYSEETILNTSNVEGIKTYFLTNWNLIISHYVQQLAEGKQYYSKILEGCKKVVAVDVGWAGSGAITLNKTVNETWGLGCDIIGLVAGTNSMYSEEPHASETYGHQGLMESYMFSQSHNRDIWKTHNPNQQHNVVIELLLASSQKSFRGFSSNHQFIFTEEIDEVNGDEIQQGILDFVIYIKERGGILKNISGRDAFAPIEVLYNNRGYITNIMSGAKFVMNLE